MIAFDAYGAAKLIATIVVGMLALTVLSIPYFVAADFFFSLSHLSDNGYRFLWVPPAAVLVVAAGYLFRKRWVPGAVALVVALGLAGGVMAMSHNLRGDVVAFGSQRNVQWAEALAGKPHYASASWIEPEAMREFRAGVSVSCCTSDFVLRDEGTYPKDISVGMRVGKYTLRPPMELATSTALTDYIELVDQGHGDWLAYYNRCVTARPITRPGASDVPRRLSRGRQCANMAAVEETFGVDLAKAATAAIIRDGGRPAALLEERGLDAACAANEHCTTFERNFAIDVK